MHHAHGCSVKHNAFFFSSRRRHTRSTRDWSSDVCSSDLTDVAVEARGLRLDPVAHAAFLADERIALTPTEFRLLARLVSSPGEAVRRRDQIGRATCRERGEISAGDVTVKKKRSTAVRLRP